MLRGTAHRLAAAAVTSSRAHPHQWPRRQLSVDNLAASMPTTCSVECPSRDASVSLAELTPLAAPTQSRTTSDDVSELAEYTEKYSSISLHRSNDAPATPLFTTTAVTGLELRPLPWPSFKCSQFWTSLVRQVKSEPGEQSSYLVALHIRPTSLQRLRVPWIHYERLKHDKIFGRSKQLRPPWPPPQLEMVDCHIEEPTRSWTYRLETVGRLMLHPVGKLVSSPSSITDHETSSPCAKLCLDDVSWKLPRWWSDTQCVRPSNATIDLSSCSWITSKHPKVQFQFFYPEVPANCHFARVHLLSRRAELSVKSNCGTSLDLGVYFGYPALNIAHTCFRMLIIVGFFLQYSLEADDLLLLISWLHVPYVQLFLGLLCSVQEYISSSSITFLASLNGRAEGQHHYTCPRVLPVAVRKGCISPQILPGNPHYSELMQWPFNHLQLQSEFRIYAPGHILLFCYALVQWKIPWTIRLAPLKFWFQCYHAQCEFIYSFKSFQLAIAWPTTNIGILYSVCVWPYLKNVGAIGRLSSEKNSLLPDREENPWYQSKLNLLLLGPDCSRDALFGWLITELYRKPIWLFPGAQDQVLITTGTLLGKMQLIRITLLWQVVQWKNADYELKIKRKFKEDLKVVKVKLPWPPPVPMCMTLPMGYGQANFQGDRSIMTRAVFIDQVHINRDYCLNYACYFNNIRADSDC